MTTNQTYSWGKTFDLDFVDRAAHSVVGSNNMAMSHYAAISDDLFFTSDHVDGTTTLFFYQLSASNGRWMEELTKADIVEILNCHDHFGKTLIDLFLTTTKNKKMKYTRTTNHTAVQFADSNGVFHLEFKEKMEWLYYAYHDFGCSSVGIDEYQTQSGSLIKDVFAPTPIIAKVSDSAYTCTFRKNFTITEYAFSVTQHDDGTISVECFCGEPEDAKSIKRVYVASAHAYYLIKHFGGSGYFAMWSHTTAGGLYLSDNKIARKIFNKVEKKFNQQQDSKLSEADKRRRVLQQTMDANNPFKQLRDLYHGNQRVS